MSVKIHPFITEYWKLDGGACFGVIPKTIWSKITPPDKHNLINIASRCLLIESAERKILIDTGIGNKYDKKFYSYFYRTKIKTIKVCIQELGFEPNDITDVIFTHLHWDHVGGASFIYKKREPELYFPNATHWCSKSGWDWAMNPSPREKKAFLKEDLIPLLNSGKLKFIEQEGAFDKNIELLILNGHTIGQLIPIINTNKGKVLFAGDFIPSLAHLPVFYVPGQDIQPLITMQEKIQIIQKALEENYTIIFQHDPLNECCKLIKTEKGIEAEVIFKWIND
jgi:glyoxylase-like metal-dependent hydrolase (beta-lactamase superfamily II)